MASETYIYRWGDHFLWHERMVIGFSSLLDGLITIGTLGFYGGRLSFNSTLWAAKNDCNRRSKNEKHS